VSIVLINLKERILQFKKTHGIPPVDFYGRLISEIDQLGWQKLISIDSSLTTLELSLKWLFDLFLINFQRDSSNRQHILTIKLPADYPLVAPECSCDLPNSLDLVWNPKSSSIHDILQQYEKVEVASLPMVST
jgi:E3 ubiquitin-protein ligase FANCL